LAYGEDDSDEGKAKTAPGRRAKLSVPREGAGRPDSDELSHEHPEVPAGHMHEPSLADIVEASQVGSAPAR
jgi:hypothetical protein